MNLWTSKNKKLCIFGIVFILGLTTVSKQKRETPEDSNLSSGDSAIWGYMVNIDNATNISKYLKKNEFSFLEQISTIQEADEYPQGLLIVDGYVFISSYSSLSGELGKIRIYNRYNGELLLSLGMDENSHLGGLAYDGEYIWVCNSSKMAVERISYTFLMQMIPENRGRLVDIRHLVEVYHVNNIPSCVTYFDGKLWVATHSVLTNGVMMAYRYDEEKKQLVPQDSYTIPPKVQGVAFSEKEEVYLSTSYGRKNTSYLIKYDSLYVMSKNIRVYRNKIKLPPCSEGIVYENKRIYIIFESAGTKYLEGTDGKGRSTAPIDKILVLDAQKLSQR